MRTKKLRLLLAASACMLAGLSAQANLVQNPDFETGALSPWTTFNGAITSSTSDVLGSYAAQLNPTISFIAQSVPIVANQTYSLDFDAKSDGQGTLTVYLDGVQVASLSALTSTYIHKSYASVTPLSIGDIAFWWADGGSHHAFVDNVNLNSVTPVPEPATMLAGALLLLPFGMSTIRILRKNRTA